MIKTLSRSLRSWVQSVFVRKALDEAIVDTASYRQQDAWLFENKGHQSLMQALPAYPGADKISDGEAHRLDRIENALSQLSERIERLRQVARSAELSMSGMPANDDLQLSISPANENALNRVADPVVSNMLFETADLRPELDDDLFELEAPARALPAYQINQIIYRQQSSAANSSHSGG